MTVRDFEVVGWGPFYRLCLELADRVKNSGRKFDLLLGINRGGLVPLRVLSDELDNPNIATVKIEFYVGIAKTAQNPTITQPPSEPVAGREVLVVDDVADTGKSLRRLRDYLASENVKSFRIATVFYKPWSEVRPDFWVRRTRKWVIFPYEGRETSLLLLNKWRGKSSREIREKFIQIGMEPYIVDRVLRSLGRRRKNIHSIHS